MEKIKQNYLEYMGDRINDEDYVRDHIYDFFNDLSNSELEDIIKFIFRN